jgi:hypothetical protein
LPALALPVACFLFLDGRLAQVSRNEYAAEVAMNGLYSFGSAFLNNELPYDKFYAALPQERAFAGLRAELKQPGAEFKGAGLDILRAVKGRGSAKKLNVVVIQGERYAAPAQRACG